MRCTLGSKVRRPLVVGVLAMTMLAAVPAAASTGGSQEPFTGSYRSIDFDGSNQLLALGGPQGGQDSIFRRVVYTDDFGTVCGGARFFGEGVGVIDGSTISVAFEIYCGNAGNLIGEDFITFTFDGATGTLTDSYDVVWTRP